MEALYTDINKTIYKEILISNKYTTKLKQTKDIYKNNGKRYRKIRLDEVRFYKDILYKEY